MAANKRKRVPSNDSTTDWLNLPSELLLSILTDFLPTKDAIRFGAVCKEWRSVSLEAKEKLRRRPWQVIETINSWGNWVPLTLRSDGQYKNIHPFTRSGRKLDAVLLGFFQRCHDDQIHLGPAGAWGALITTSQGWLIQRSEQEVFMSDPRTGSVFPLPSIPYNMNHNIQLSKALVLPSSSSDSSSRYTVAAISRDWNKASLAVGQVGGEQWRFAEVETHLDDINYHEGLIYSVSLEGNVLVWDLFSSSSGEMTPRAVIPGPVGLQRDHCSARKLYVVPATPFGLLLIARYPYEVRVFALSKARSREWVQVRKLEGHSLFLGRNQSTCLSKTDLPEMKESGVYVTSDVSTWKRDRPWQLYCLTKHCHRYGFFNLEDGSFQNHQHPLLQYGAAWVIPGRP